MNLLKIYFFLASFQAIGQGIDFSNMTPQQVQQVQNQINVPQQAVVPGVPNVFPGVKPPAPPKAGPYTQTETGPNNSKELEKKVAVRIKDPFMLPNHLYMKIKKKLGDVQGEGYVDESVEPQRRWALRHYKLIAIIWNVKKPKAMITDKQNNLHIFHVNDYIGNNEGIIKSIGNGAVFVDEKGIEARMKIAN